MEEDHAEDDADDDQGETPDYPDRRCIVVRLAPARVAAAAHGEGGSPAEEPS
jgi:hypothetical protein